MATRLQKLEAWVLRKLESRAMCAAVKRHVSTGHPGTCEPDCSYCGTVCSCCGRAN